MMTKKYTVQYCMAKTESQYSRRAILSDVLSYAITVSSCLYMGPDSGLINWIISSSWKVCLEAWKSQIWPTVIDTQMSDTVRHSCMYKQVKHRTQKQWVKVERQSHTYIHTYTPLFSIITQERKDDTKVKKCTWYKNKIQGHEVMY